MIALCALASLLCVALGALCLAVQRFGRADRACPAEAIVVLGARVSSEGAPSGALKARTAHGVLLYRRRLAPLLVFTGGIGEHPPAEAVLARALAVEQGVPPEACLLETRSRTTLENAQFTAQLLEGRGIRRVILVSDPYHLLRASRLFGRAGLCSLPSPATMEGRGYSRAALLRCVLREAVVLFLQPGLLFSFGRGARRST